MGVAGAAWATNLSQAVSAALCLIYMFIKVPVLRPERKHWRIHKRDSRIQMAIGIPMAFQFAITASGTMIMQSAINLFGSEAVAAYTAAGKLQNLVTQGMVAMGQTMATYGGQNYGKGDLGRIRQGVRAALKAEFIYSIAAGVLVCLLLEPCLGLFFSGDVDIHAMMPWAKPILYVRGIFYSVKHDLYFPQYYAGVRIRILADDGRRFRIGGQTFDGGRCDQAFKLSFGLLL